MKKMTMSLFAVSLILASATSLRANDPVPETVIKAFQDRYPGATVEDWDHERDGTYEVEFTYQGVEWEAYYNGDGTWIRTERDVRERDLPADVRGGFDRSEYASYEIDDVEEYQTPEHESVYVLELEDRGKDIYIYLLPDGTLVK